MLGFYTPALNVFLNAKYKNINIVEKIIVTIKNFKVKKKYYY